MYLIRTYSMVTIVLSASIVAGCQSQQSFKTPDDAVAALETAVQKENKKDLRELFGTRIDELKTGDAEVDDSDFIIFSRRLEAAHKIEPDGPDRATILIGQEQWPFAVPLVKEKKGWRFDTDAGIEEMTNRYIGRNERLTIDACFTVIDAQAEFFERDPDGCGVKHFAPRIMSTEGKKDGLYWPVTGNEDPSPIGPVFAMAATRKDEKGQRIPFNGYFYRLLTSQGPTAPGGAMDYMSDGKLTRGWAAIGWPAKYGHTGIMSFMFGSDGTVYEKDLGDDSSMTASEMSAFDPGDGWTAVNR